MKKNGDFTLTVKQVAAEAQCQPQTVYVYARLGLIEWRSIGDAYMLLFKPGTGELVKKLKAHRMAHRKKGKARPRLGATVQPAK